ncbi:MAG: hypothetical protein WC965_02215 [Thiohalomonadaceae bacterium]
MRKVYLLDDSDQIEATDYARPLVLFYLHDGRVPEHSQYSGRKINHLSWLPVAEIAQQWIGATVEEFNNIGIPYEFVRGYEG